MNNPNWIKPHGDLLVNLIVDQKRGQVLKEISLNLPDITLTERHLCDLELIASGAFSPLTGFMTKSDYESVIDRMELQNQIKWPLPICLDVTETIAKSLEAGQSLALRDQEGFLLAVMHLEDIWPIDRKKEALGVYGTTNQDHPGVHYLFQKTGDYYIGGQLEVLSLPLHFDFKQLRLTPLEVRRIYRKLGWQRVVGFQTNNAIHRPQFELIIKAMQKARANLLLLPNVGITRPGDFDHYTRVRCHQKIVKHFPPDSYILNLLPLAMRMAGPKEALLHMIIAKNYGCTHFIIGHDHAGPGVDKQNIPFYKNDEAIQLASLHAKEIGLSIISSKEMVYLPFEDEYRQASDVPPKSETISLSGSDIRKRIIQGKKIPQWATFPEVVKELCKAYPPPKKQGFTIFFTGLSGAGKSTVAKVLFSRFLEIGKRPVTLLDGDIVRQNLSSELSFSKEHRDINVHRIGFVASEITKNRGIAICAPIAPYQETRQEIRSSIEKYGGFIEVHVATPLDECEKRDRKGMYAKARAGLIKGYTGVDDPYDIPLEPEVRIDTSDLTPGEAAQEILLFLSQQGYT